jgi:hypothetical protein
MDKSEKNITVDNKNVITRRKVIRGKTKISEIPVPEIGKSDSSHFGFGSQFPEFGKSDSSHFAFGSQFGKSHSSNFAFGSNLPQQVSSSLENKTNNILQNKKRLYEEIDKITLDCISHMESLKRKKELLCKYKNELNEEDIKLSEFMNDFH